MEWISLCRSWSQFWLCLFKIDSYLLIVRSVCSCILFSFSFERIGIREGWIKIFHNAHLWEEGVLFLPIWKSWRLGRPRRWMFINNNTIQWMRWWLGINGELEIPLPEVCENPLCPDKASCFITYISTVGSGWGRWSEMVWRERGLVAELVC